MHDVRRLTRLLLATGLCLVLGLAVTACGGSGPKPGALASDTPTPTPSSASPTSTPSSSTTPTQQPLSPFEGTKVVKVTRKWMAAVARSINSGDRSMSATRPFSTGDPARFAAYVTKEFGLYYPGPEPFTPVDTRVTGSTASIPICLLTAGWGQKRSTKLPSERRKVEPVSVSLKKVAGAWTFDSLAKRSGSCKGVPVKGVAW